MQGSGSGTSFRTLWVPMSESLIRLCRWSRICRSRCVGGLAACGSSRPLRRSSSKSISNTLAHKVVVSGRSNTSLSLLLPTGSSIPSRGPPARPRCRSKSCSLAQGEHWSAGQRRPAAAGLWQRRAGSQGQSTAAPAHRHAARRPAPCPTTLVRAYNSFSWQSCQVC